MSKKKPVDLFGDDTSSKPAANSFEALLNSSQVTGRRLSPGDRIRGEVLAVTGQEAFVSTGTPTDAVMPFTVGPNGEKPKAGDSIEVIVVRVREGEILVKEVGGRGGPGVDTDSLEDAFDMELPVEGLVTEAIKGGFRVKIQGVSGFCPISQIDRRCDNPADYVGRKFDFVITKWEKGRDLVVSRRKILDQEQALAEGDFQENAQIGEIFSATIFRIEKYGAFCRLDNGIEGLIPISEMSFSRINHPQEVVNLNDKVQVKLMAVREEEGRMKISFSLKEGGGLVDPWENLEAMYPIGTVLDGDVENKEAFGIFVRVAGGVTGLLPRSAWRDSVDGKTYENKRRGDSIKVRISVIDKTQRKLTLGLPGQDDDDQSWREHQAAGGSAAKSGSFGTMADLLKGISVKKS